MGKVKDKILEWCETFGFSGPIVPMDLGDAIHDLEEFRHSTTEQINLLEWKVDRNSTTRLMSQFSALLVTERSVFENYLDNPYYGYHPANNADTLYHRVGYLYYLRRKGLIHLAFRAEHDILSQLFDDMRTKGNDNRYTRLPVELKTIVEGDDIWVEN